MDQAIQTLSSAAVPALVKEPGRSSSLPGFTPSIGPILPITRPVSGSAAPAGVAPSAISATTPTALAVRRRARRRGEAWAMETSV